VESNRTMFTLNSPALFLNGIPLEKAVYCFMDNENLGSVYSHNDFNPSVYPNEKYNIVDGKLTDKVLIECTNPKDSTFLNDSIMENKIEYFFRADPLHALIWVLIVSFTNFSDYIKNELTRHGIILIILGLTATNTNLKTIIKHLYHTRLYGLIKRLKLRTKPKNPAQSITSITTLSQYSNVSCSPSISNRNNLHRPTNTNLSNEDRAILEELSKPVKPSNLEWLRYKWDMEES